MNNLKHGLSKTKIYGIWSAMLARCNNPNTAAYKNYGGRGISVSDDWHTFENFHIDMGERPEGLSLDRIDNDAGYSKENCRWATRLAQRGNRRGIKYVTCGGETLSIADWSRKTGLNISTIWARINKGWSHEDAVSIGVLKNAKGIPRNAKLRDNRDKTERC